MKFLIAFACMMAVASAGYVTPYTAAYSPYHYAYSPVHANGYSYTSYSAAAPAFTAYTAPVTTGVVAAPAVVAAHPHHHHVIAAPAVVPSVVPAAVEKTQYHTQDTLGQASYGHSETFQQHHASQDAAGNKVGSYSYVAPDGQVVAANYVADSLGYRVASNALPVGPAHLPAPVGHTPEVVAATAAHLAAHVEAKSRGRRALVSTYSTPYTTSTYHGYTGYSGYTPYTYGAYPYHY